MTNETSSSSADAVFALITAAQQLAGQGRVAEAEQRYRDWLAAHVEHDQPLRYAIEFNLALLLAGRGEAGEAEALLRTVTQRQPALGQAWLQLGILQRDQGRPDEALDTWSVMLGKVDPAADQGIYVAGLNHIGLLLEELGRAAPAQKMFARSLQQYPAQPEIAQREGALRERLAQEAAAFAAALPARLSDPDDVQTPMVSILMPTHNRPDYAELALQSALAQTWRNIEIVISDNSDNDDTERRFAPYIAQHPCIRYLRVPSCTALENFLNCYDHARGEYINFLMDDDLFHPQKLERMMDCLLGQSTVGLVTSFRQLIDDVGREMPPSSPSTQRMFDTMRMVSGADMSRYLLTSGQNVLGEPTTVLFRKRELKDRFGRFHGHQYSVISDMVSWLAILANTHCVYLPEPLSYFRIHGEQGQNLRPVQVRGALENLRVVVDSWRHTPALFEGVDVRSLVTQKLTHFITLMSAWHEDLARLKVDLEPIHQVIRDATELLLAPPTPTESKA